jgi:hypothetical protein
MTTSSPSEDRLTDAYGTVSSSGLGVGFGVAVMFDVPDLNES